MITGPKWTGGAIPRLLACALGFASVLLTMPAAANQWDDDGDSPRSVVGRASWYGREFAGRKTASGERFNPEMLTGAHRTLPLGSKVRVTNLNNGRSVLVTITDRGPFIRHRIIDLSEGAARELRMVRRGVASVMIQPL